ncbi:CCRG-2 family RiPP [Prochlorococcus marinus]|uniref:CCRG-2 family RiPP n=1 Tax=Prochlorococcus marinus TaxID=1219 RepID=UPI0007B3B4F0|nr:CCRG-2 family RiPP [Prochlorococcus marinus]KZR73512.1 hypothetical protein PMIT1320_02106 [Prochlorococcus marinus str. MIT 1320]
MTNNELTIEELQGIAGGALIRSKQLLIINPDSMCDPIYKVRLDTGPVNKNEVGPIGRER